MIDLKILKKHDRIRQILSRVHMGDSVASVAQPIARGIDKAIGTRIQECEGCKRRRKLLNDLTQYNK